MRTPEVPVPGATAGPTVVLGVAASDAHAVANHLIAHLLRESGYDVVNLGPCTSIAEFAAAVAQHPRTLAVVIGSLNGHVYEDLRGLRQARESNAIECPVLVGGNLTVGHAKDPHIGERLRALGVDRVLTDPEQLLDVLSTLVAERGEPARRSA